MYFYLLWLPTCFGQSCGHLQGDLFYNKTTILIKMCLDRFQLELYSSHQRNHPEDGHMTGRNMLVTITQ